MKKAFLCVLAAAILLLCACKGTDTAMTVNGTDIDEAEFAFYLNYNRYDILGSGRDASDAEMGRIRAAAVEQIVSNEVVRQKCREAGLSLSRAQKAQLKADKDAFIDSVGGKANYLTYLRESYLTDRAYDKMQENELYFSMLYDSFLAENETTFSDNDLRRFYAENYTGVKYIFLSVTDENGEPMDEESTAAVRKKAEEVLEKAKAEGSDFEALINEYSDDVFLTGGSEGVIVSRLEAEGQAYLEGAFNIPDNGIGGVYSDAAGFYIIKRVPADASFYEENQADIHATSLDMRFAATLEQWCADAEVDVRSSAQKINFENIQSYIR